MANYTEAEVRDPVVKYALELGALHKRNVFRRGMPVGWPDDTFYLPNGVVLEVEFKATNKEPNRKQEDKIARLRDAHFFVLVIDNEAEGFFAIDVCLSLDDMIYMHAARPRACALEKEAARRSHLPYRAIIENCRKIEV